MSVRKKSNNIMRTRKKTKYHGDVPSEDKNVYLGNLNVIDDNDHPIPWHQEVRINQLERRLSILERTLGPANIIKATPAIALLYMDMNCKKRVKIIYENWTKFMGYISREKNGLTIESVFWALDHFIFEKFFTHEEIKVYIVPLNINKEYTMVDMEYINKCLIPDRDDHHNLKKPSDKEFISSLVSGKQVFMMYYPYEIQQQQQSPSPPQLSPFPKKNPVQLKTPLHPELSLTKSIVSEIDSSSIGIKSNDNLQLETTSSSSSLDKRLIILGSQRPLYNSIVDINQIDTYQESLFSMGEPALRLALMVYHAMIHIKTDMSLPEESNKNRGHSNEFLEHFVNYTPSALFGHYMFPPLTIDD